MKVTKEEELNKYPFVPGRNLVTKHATQLRLDYLHERGIETEALQKGSIPLETLSSNIESYIGTVEVPIGLAGPLKFVENGQEEMLHSPIGTLEGALLASINRGCRVLTLSGGFKAEVIHQKMLRSPMFIFSSIKECVVFREWVSKNYSQIKFEAEAHSNHGQLLSIDARIAGRSVHLKFIYSTGDASGQNMTTTCTKFATEWINTEFSKQTGIPVVHHVIEGNGASDKKVSHYTINNGRGIHVVAECELDEAYVNKVLRTTSADFARCYNASTTMSRIDGMVGYNINVANAIAGIFVATGQDLASIHESGVGMLNVELTEKGLYLSLHLSNLVIGTVGGGTHLAKQKEALQLCGCYGKGKAHRFAKLIAGFALALEVSTFAAVVGGHFAAAHEKMGRNKPTNWLTLSDIDLEFIRSGLHRRFKPEMLQSININHSVICGDGIFMNLAHEVNKKRIGFTVVDASWSQDSTEQPPLMLLKSKPLDSEAIEGFMLMASAVDPLLPKLISKHHRLLEYYNCHIKELDMYEWLAENGFAHMPAYYGRKIDRKREIYLFYQEYLDPKHMRIIDSEQEPELWTSEDIQHCLDAAHEFHRYSPVKAGDHIEEFKPFGAAELYGKLIEVVKEDMKHSDIASGLEALDVWLENMASDRAQIKVEPRIIHNDYNSRNIAIGQDGQVYIYDWELSVLDLPQRDIMEFLCFTLPLDFEEETLMGYLDHHFRSWPEYSREELMAASSYALRAFVITRVLFYMAGRIVVEFDFAERVLRNALRIHQILER